MHRDEVIQASAANRVFSIALLGNPNSGKTSLFNQLTGLRQKVGNFPGVTVEKKSGKMHLPGSGEVNLLDLPGAYSFYPTSQDERIVVQTLLNPDDPHYPDAILYVADLTKLEKHLLLFSQLRDLGLPMALALNMADLAGEGALKLNASKLEKDFGVPVTLISSRTGAGIPELIAQLDQLRDKAPGSGKSDYQPGPMENNVAAKVKEILPGVSPYRALLIAHHAHWLPFLNRPAREAILKVCEETGFQSLNSQVTETLERFGRFTPLVRKVVRFNADSSDRLTCLIDSFLTHRVWGPLVFFLVMMLIFQAIYAWAQYPMAGIEWVFGTLGDWVKNTVSAPWLSGLLADGLLAGLGGILVFVPQIAILFFLIALLEEVGYMARAAYMFDRLMQFFGLNGRSIVSLISGGACAIPAVMSTRSISNWKERLITILVTPFISCSARIPVYTALIGFAVPARTIAGVFNLQGLAFMGLYLLGIVAALGSAWVLKKIIRTRERSFLALELPTYRAPVMRNVWFGVWEKVKSFVLEAGKVILVISFILWALASYGPGGEMEAVERQARTEAAAAGMDEHATDNLVASRRIEASYAGHIGKVLEPVIAPLGFDWKMGIAIVVSFAAREVFVGTMSTIYSLGGDGDEYSLHERMARETDPDTGKPVYNPATSWSLLLFYVFAMMCMSTLAVVKRETNSWKWPVIQFAFMTGVAYLCSWGVYAWLG